MHPSGGRWFGVVSKMGVGVLYIYETRVAEINAAVAACRFAAVARTAVVC